MMELIFLLNAVGKLIYEFIKFINELFIYLFLMYLFVWSFNEDQWKIFRRYFSLRMNFVHWTKINKKKIQANRELAKVLALSLIKHQNSLIMYHNSISVKSLYVALMGFKFNVVADGSCGASMAFYLQFFLFFSRFIVQNLIVFVIILIIVER